MRVLVTGAAGFVAHHVVSRLQHTHDVVALVRCGRIGNLNRLKEIGFIGPVYWHDLRSPISETLINQIGHIDAVVHMAAETHVDRSITDPLPFVMSNVLGTAHILQYARVRNVGKFIQFSTDEVFGPASEGTFFGETHVHSPKNPYAATKSAAEQLVTAWSNTYGLNTSIVRSMNVFGERQHSEKYIPKIINYVKIGKTVRVHANAELTKAGSRLYTYAPEIAKVIDHVLTRDIRMCHIVGEEEVDNRELVEKVAGIMGKEPRYELVNFHESRPGHDLRYALADSYLCWNHELSFDAALEKTVKWFLGNPAWL